MHAPLVYSSSHTRRLARSFNGVSRDTHSFTHVALTARTDWMAVSRDWMRLSTRWLHSVRPPRAGRLDLVRNGQDQIITTICVIRSSGSINSWMLNEPSAAYILRFYWSPIFDRPTHTNSSSSSRTTPILFQGNDSRCRSWTASRFLRFSAVCWRWWWRCLSLTGFYGHVLV